MNDKKRTIYVSQRVGRRMRWLEAGTAIERRDGTLDVFLDRMPVGGFNGHIHVPGNPMTRPTVKDMPTEMPFEGGELIED